MPLAEVQLSTIAIISILAVAWLFCAFTTAALARNNGQSYSLWFWVGFFTGPLGLFCAYLYFRFSGERRRRIRYGSGRQYDDWEMITCPRCHQSVPASFTHCQFCGEPLHGRRR